MQFSRRTNAKNAERISVWAGKWNEDIDIVVLYVVGVGKFRELGQCKNVENKISTILSNPKSAPLGDTLT